MNPITSPTLPTDPGIVHTAKEFSDNLTLELTDAEIKRAFEITMRIRQKWMTRFRYKFTDPTNFTVEDAAKLIDQMEDELVYTLATELDLIATVDMAPVFEGEPPVIEFVGCLPSHYSMKYGADHERKSYEVKKAKERGEAYLGEHSNPNTIQAKKRNKSGTRTS